MTRGCPELCDAWVRGYSRILPLAEQDVAEIGTFVLLRRLQLVAWVGSHRFADAALELGAEFTGGCCEIAERYLLGARANRPTSPGSLRCSIRSGAGPCW